jgi:hypothetical protein
MYQGRVTCRTNQNDPLDHLDYRTRELKESITSLKDLITTMVEEDKDTKGHSELLIEMLRVLEAVKKFEENTLNAFSVYDSLSRSKLPKR